jgi:NADPH:quinone reductase-like Zn-dependent oxidoreductase
MLLPDEITYEQAAPIFCAGYTVYDGLRTADLKPHDRPACKDLQASIHYVLGPVPASNLELLL